MILKKNGMPFPPTTGPPPDVRGDSLVSSTPTNHRQKTFCFLSASLTRKDGGGFCTAFCGQQVGEADSSRNYKGEGLSN
ncbi:hypothetical protein JTE90_018668 [Oedothorax gibbosus]|uniref:Uncharacterized protein n=1 Tax=Oedothorax gibbosus TaxID=931172 RepID=A0AAV6V1K0_9ARAC|nr:hypothetical protein JTE90_018668 [Oedothorax gibbosus]